MPAHKAKQKMNKGLVYKETAVQGRQGSKSTKILLTALNCEMRQIAPLLASHSDAVRVSSRVPPFVGEERVTKP